MANYSAIKASVDAYIKQNGRKEITGRILNSVLNATIESLGKYFQFCGVITPDDVLVNPSPDQNVAYIGGAGTYHNFDGQVIEVGFIGIFLWDGEWHVNTIPVGKDYDQDIQEISDAITNLSDAITNLSNDVIHLDDVNEDDLTIPEGGKLQFADRLNGLNTTGMGYVILRKNKTFIEQVTRGNTIYEIRDDFSLSANFSMPDNCALFFNGGKISGNYNLTGNNTTIYGKLDSIFDGITLIGKYTNTSCNVCWWGCTPFDESNQVDNSATLDKIFAGSIKEILVDRKYGISFPVKLPNYSIVKGSRGTALRDYGFVANDNFASKSVDVRGETFTAEGMCYYYSDMNPRLDNISLDARWFAPYCLEHITGYAAPIINQCVVYNASVAGIVQYACEKPLWKEFAAKFCHCGIFISSTKINKTDVLDLTGATMGRNNMVTLSGCVAIGCNYGMILNSGSNTILESCETAYNALWGLVTNGRIAVSNFYSEGDCLCNFLYVDGVKKTNPLGDGYVPDEIITDNLDGMLVTDSLVYGQDIRFRSPIYIRGGQMSVKDVFISLKPRSYVTTNVAKADFELPSVRDAAGVDSAFVVGAFAARMALRLYGNIKIFTLNGDTGDLPESMVVVGNTNDLNPAPTIIMDADPQIMHPVFLAKQILFDFNYNLVGQENRTRSPQTFEEHGLRLPDYNSMIETARWGGFGNSSKFDFRRNRFVELYDGIPLYKRDTTISNYNTIYFAKERIAELFGDAKELKVHFIVKFNASQTSRINLSIRFFDSSYSLRKNYNYNTGGDVTYEGIYDCIVIVPLAYLADDTWDKICLILSVGNEASIDVLVSDMLMYPVHAPIVPPVYSCYYAQSGTTANRPTANPGQIYFDTNLNKAIMWNGTAWVNVDGSALA